MTLKELKKILNKYPKECDDYKVMITHEEFWESDDCYHIMHSELPEPEGIIPGTNQIVFDITE